MHAARPDPDRCGHIERWFYLTIRNSIKMEYLLLVLDAKETGSSWSGNLSQRIPPIRSRLPPGNLQSFSNCDPSPLIRDIERAVDIVSPVSQPRPPPSEAPRICQLARRG